MADVAGSPRYELLEAARCIWQGRADDAAALLEGLAERLPPAVEPVRLRYLAMAHHAAGRPGQASEWAEAARRAAVLAGDVEEQVRTRAVLGRIHARSAAPADRDLAISLLGQCGRACDDGVIDDDHVHFGCLVDLAAALGSRDQPDAALAALKRAIDLSVRFGDPSALADLYNGMAETRLGRGDVPAAIVYKQRSVQVHEEIALRARISAAFDHAATLADRCGDGPTMSSAEGHA